MRGKRIVRFCSSVDRRITPAHAGKTVARSTNSAYCSDHPRACGENCHDVELAGAVAGSPPRMRGKRFVNHAHNSFLRITPAHAGKTGGCSHNSRAHEDHPRACGENASQIADAKWLTGSPPRMRGKRMFCGIIGLTTSGSPPRMRGKRVCLRSLLAPPRITPAHAGKTSL